MERGQDARCLPSDGHNWTSHFNKVLYFGGEVVDVRKEELLRVGLNVFLSTADLSFS